MYLFPTEGIMATILSYGQMLSIVLVLVVFEGVISAMSKTATPGLVFLGLVVLLAVGVGIGFGEFTYFLFMLIPAFLCFIAFVVSRKNRAKNIAKGVEYNKDGLIEDELKKMQQGE